MVTIRVKVDITENREVTIKLPDDFPVGEAEITVAAETEAIGIHDAGWDSETELSPDEIKEYLNFKGLPFGEIETGGWEDREIEDSVQFVKELRRKAWRKHELE